MTIEIPGQGILTLRWLVADFNGTLAVDGTLLPGVAGRLGMLARDLDIQVVTADTFRSAEKALAGLPVTVSVLPADGQDRRKRVHVAGLGAAHTVCMGNGRNDEMMLEAARLGIAVLEGEGACTLAIEAADVVCRSATEALDLLLNPKRLIATLRR